ncbi:putative membrane protein [Alteromonas macleodii]|uniref:Membrane protein n=1 Tax=Alteromonas macleodii TaxID=28108 RepID=A0AB36FQG7_ALTMA|nr:putative membrane protein [Alteromonas macleodii]OES31165.1 putative membrane protein [Alteromonas macleodii]OES31857.1 putative membrane protein [Alteromonas macleodii]OES40802.1 putative membrane protein [Alteromonas macleodii]
MKVRPSKKLYLKMMCSILVLCIVFGGTAFVWSTSVYECIPIFSWEFCGSIGQAEIVYALIAFDSILVLYIASPFITFFSLSKIIRNRNKNN